mmetsp:Transcript_8227/g.16202  ORF Transcript_8227/g.16202 Transcript_8227/m.16202 type:complete len:336 (+) Transcript_8227:3576-4583(+)
MKQVVSIHVGQTGVQVGSSVWELFCREHSIQPDGMLAADSTTDTSSHVESFFRVNESGKHTPRAIFIDTDSNATDALAAGQYGSIYENVIGGNKNSSNLFSKGSRMLPQDLSESLTDSLNKQVENCDSFEGFLLYHSTGGGTGSGTSALILNSLADTMPGSTVLDFPVFPCPQLSNSVLDPYNSTLLLNSVLEKATAAVWLDNEALFEMCRRYFNIESPEFSDMNELIAQSVSDLTSSMRLGGTSLTSLADLINNLAPSPRLNLLLTSLAPILNAEKAHVEFSSEDLAYLAFEKGFSLANVSPTDGSFLSCIVNYRGAVTSTEVEGAISNVKGRL